MPPTLIDRLLEAAGADPDTVELVDGHWTDTGHLVVTVRRPPARHTITLAIGARPAAAGGPVHPYGPGLTS